MSIEHAYSQPMSNFSLPYLKDISAANRRAVMSEEWEQLATKEMMTAVRDAEKRWEKCCQLLQGKIRDGTEIDRWTGEWSQCVSKIILSLHSDIIAVSESRNENTQEQKEAAWNCAGTLGKWSKAIAYETDPKALQKFAYMGVEFLKSHNLTPKDALNELKLVVAREIKIRTGI